MDGNPTIIGSVVLSKLEEEIRKGERGIGKRKKKEKTSSREIFIFLVDILQEGQQMTTKRNDKITQKQKQKKSFRGIFCLEQTQVGGLEWWAGIFLCYFILRELGMGHSLPNHLIPTSISQHNIKKCIFSRVHNLSIADERADNSQSSRGLFLKDSPDFFRQCLIFVNPRKP